MKSFNDEKDAIIFMESNSIDGKVYGRFAKKGQYYWMIAETNSDLEFINAFWTNQNPPITLEKDC